jgi:tyrosine-protein kinase Etk/Wzc
LRLPSYDSLSRQPMNTSDSPDSQQLALRGGFDFSVVLGSLISSWRFIFGAGIGFGILCMAISFLVDITYKATAIIMPPDRTTNALSLIGSSSGGASSIPGGALAALSMGKSPGDLYVALLASPGLENDVVKRCELQTVYKAKLLSQARKLLETNTLVLSDSKSGLISISVVDKDPNRAAEIVGEYINALNKLSSRLAITDAQRRSLFFEQQVTETKENLNRAEEALKETQQKSGLVEPVGDARALIEFEGQLRAQIASKTVELESMRVNLADDNPQIQTARRELQGLQTQASDLSRKTGSSTFSSRNGQTEASLDYIRKLRDVKYYESLFQLLTQNLEMATLDEARQGNIVQTVEAASPPDVKNGPHRSIFLAAGLLLGFFAGGTWVLTRPSFGRVSLEFR